MQHFSAWVRNKTRLITVSFFVAGVIVLTSVGITHLRPPTAEAEVNQEFAAALPEAEATDTLEPTAAPTRVATVIVYISGAVRAPDVYELPSEARIKDLVLAAGGLTPDADPEQINMAGRLKDEQHIRVPRQGEVLPADTEAAQGDATTEGNGPLDINSASAADLEGLPGIGKALAERIVEYRTANGPFKSVEDLRNVKGIGPALFEKIASLVTVGL